MTIDNTDGVNKQVTLQFTDEEWAILQWINTRRSPARFLEWLSAQFQVMAQRKEQELQMDIKQAWHSADEATKNQIKTLLGVI